MKQRKGLHIFFSSLLLGALGFVVWWMADHVVWLGDDLDYKFKMHGEIWQSWGFINTFQDLINSQIVHYENVNGRFVAHFLVQLFNGILGQKIFAICNAIIYVFFAIALANLGNVVLSGNSGGTFTAICLSVICFVTKMMPTCQIGYIWGMLINLLWLSAFFSKGKLRWYIVALMFLFGIIAGNWQESVSIGVCAALGIWWLSKFFDHSKTIHTFFDWRRSWIMLGYFIGTAINCFSPATISRVKTVNISITDQLIISSYSLTAVIILIVVLITLAFKRKGGISMRLNDESGIIPDCCLVIALISLLVFNALIGIYSNRQLFGANLFATILTLRVLPAHRFNVFFNFIVGMAMLAIWTVMYIGISEVKRQYDDIIELYSTSQNGVVEYDRTRVMILGHPSDAKYYEDIIGQFDNDISHSMMKNFKHEKNGMTFYIKPTLIPTEEMVVQYSPGHFNVSVKEPAKEEHPREITLHGHYSILRIINIPAMPRKLQLLKYLRRQSPYAVATVIPDYPLFRVDSISF